MPVRHVTISASSPALRPDRDGVRTLMQWTGGPNAGFSSASASALYSQPISDPVYGPAAVNAAAQLRDPSSLLHWMRDLVPLRKQFRVFGRGSFHFVATGNRTILAYVRRWGDDTVLCVANVSWHMQPATLDLSAYEGARPIERLGHTRFPRIDRAPWFVSLGGYGFAWFELSGAPVGEPPRGA